MRLFYTKWLFITTIIFFACHSFASIETDSLLKVATGSSDKKESALAYYKLSTYYGNHADYPNAISYLNKAFSIYNALNDERNIVECYMQFGILESYRGNYPYSANYFLRSLLYAEKNNDTSVLYAVCINLTSVYSALENYKKANYYLSKINVEDLKKDIELRVNYLGNKGQIEYELGNYKVALKNLEEGITIFDPNVPDINLIQFLILTGDCAIKLKDANRANTYYTKALKLAVQGEFPVQLAHIYYGLANVHRTNDKKLALEYSNKSLEFAKKYEVLDLVANNHKAQSEIYNELGMQKFALEQYKLYDIAIDSVFSIDSKDNIDLLEANYKVEKSKNEIEKLTLINDKNTLQKSIFLIVSIVTLFAILFLVFTLRKRNLLNSKLKKSNLVKDKLLSIIAHDLKSPLHNISSVLNEIENDSFSKEEQTKVVQNLNTQTEVTIETLENLLKWGQAQLRGIVIKQVQINLSEAVNSNLNLYQTQLKQKSIKVNVDISIDFIVNFDKDHLDFIIRNLIGNAIKFSYPNSEIHISAIKEDSNKLKLIVKDFGVGIDNSDIGNIFQPSTNTRLGTNNEKGSGLGLALCKEFAEANHSDLTFTSEISKGSEFCLTCLI